MASNKGLGRGLGALLGDSFDEIPENSPYKLLPIYKVEPNASQPRQDFDECNNKQHYHLEGSRPHR